MGIDIGTRIGTYRITGPIGAGGMGEVYRAADERLGRDVAIKVLTEIARADAAWRDRFEREARLLAAINHPHIGAIYGVEQIGESPALILELVEGPTLAARLRDGPLPVAVVVEYAKQIADAVAAAHAKGIIHRDLKPGNIVIAAGDRAKVLDFGLAKSMVTAPNDAATRTVSLTREGTVMGTAAYMSPEQARGLKVDEQADIWAFGCVVYEMLTGRRAFDGATSSDVIAAILKTDPDWSRLPADAPRNVVRVVRRCLEKDVNRRLYAIADARLDLEEDEASPRTPAASARPAVKVAIVAAIVSAIAAGGYTASLYLRPEPDTLPVARYAIAGSGEFLDGTGVAISNDGKTVAYSSEVSGNRRVAVRRLDEIEPRHLPGTEGGTQPFFSPDGQWIGFFSAGKLRKIPVAGGTSEIVTDAANPRGGAWGPDDSIIFAPGPVGPLMRVAASGGAATPITQLGPRESSHRYPEFLPGGKAILYASGPPATVTLWSEASIVGESLVEPRRRTVIAPRGTTPKYLSSGHVLYAQLTQLYAVPFNVGRLETTGAAIQLDDHVSQVGTGFAQFDVAGGVLASVPSSFVPSGELALVDRTGAATPLGVRVPFQSEMRISPDGSKIAYTGATPDAEVWIYDIQQRSMGQLTTGGANVWPAWSPDGKRIVYGSFRGGGYTTFVRDASGGPEREMARGGHPMQWLPDGSALVVGYRTEDGYLSLLPEGSTTLLPLTPVGPRDAAPSFSPNGRLIAMVSLATGRPEVVVSPYPGPGERVRVSKDGGAEPVFSRDGRSLFYRRGLEMMIVDVTPGPVPRFSEPRLLFNGTSFSGAGNRANFDVMPDGRHFVMIKLDQSRPPLRLVVTQNWQESIRDKLRR